LDLLLAILLDSLWVLGLGMRLRLPWGSLRRALEDLGRPLLLNSTLLLLAEGLGTWLGGSWGNSLLGGVVAGASLYRLGSLTPPLLSRWVSEGFGLGAVLRDLVGSKELAAKV
jgi:hypothetical protein